MPTPVSFLAQDVLTQVPHKWTLEVVDGSQQIDTEHYTITATIKGGRVTAVEEVTTLDGLYLSIAPEEGQVIVGRLIETMGTPLNGTVHTPEEGKNCQKW